MTRPGVYLPLEQSYTRNVLFAVEVLDAVTLTRLSQGVTVTAHGLAREPVVNAGGLFVWLKEDITKFQGLDVDSGILPHESRQFTAAELQRPLWTIELPPRRSYPFTRGVAGIAGMLIDTRVAAPTRPVPVAGASVRLRWLDDNGMLRDASTVSHTDDKGGFAAIVRLAPTDVPRVDAAGALTVRLQVDRGGTVRTSPDLPLTPGLVDDSLLPFAWDELQP
jgi:hypothetical protein